MLLRLIILGNREVLFWSAHSHCPGTSFFFAIVLGGEGGRGGQRGKSPVSKGLHAQSRFW